MVKTKTHLQGALEEGEREAVTMAKGQTARATVGEMATVKAERVVAVVVEVAAERVAEETARAAVARAEAAEEEMGVATVEEEMASAASARLGQGRVGTRRVQT